MNKLKFILRCVVSIALIALVLSKVDWTKLGEALGRLNWHVAIPASFLIPLLIASLAFRWRIFLRQQGIEIPFRTIFSLTWAGQFFNSVLPGSTGGDVVKIYQLCRLAPDRKAAAAAAVVVDRFSALVALVMLAGFALVIYPAPLNAIESHAGSMKSKFLILAAVAGIAGLGAWFLYRYIRASHWHGRLQRMLIALKSSLVINPLLFAAMFISFGIHCLNFFIAFLFARALGISMTYSQVMLIFPVLLLLVMLPLTVNGHGLREVILIFYFNHLHVVLAGNTGIGVRETVIAFSVVLVSNDLLWSLPGGLWYILKFKRPQEMLHGKDSPA